MVLRVNNNTSFIECGEKCAEQLREEANELPSKHAINQLIEKSFSHQSLTKKTIAINNNATNLINLKTYFCYKTHKNICAFSWCCLTWLFTKMYTGRIWQRCKMFYLKDKSSDENLRNRAGIFIYKGLWIIVKRILNCDDISFFFLSFFNVTRTGLYMV